MQTKNKRKCPHVKPVGVVNMQVCKLGSWEGRGPYGLFVDVLDGGSFQLAQGTKTRMCEIQRVARRLLSNNWSPARFVADLIWEAVPAVDRPPR
jgi:hypothetical protein